MYTLAVARPQARASVARGRCRIACSTSPPRRVWDTQVMEVYASLSLSLYIYIYTHTC